MHVAESERERVRDRERSREIKQEKEKKRDSKRIIFIVAECRKFVEAFILVVLQSNYKNMNAKNDTAYS